MLVCIFGYYIMYYVLCILESKVHGEFSLLFHVCNWLSAVMSADTHRLHHVSGLAWIDEHTLVTTSHDASIKQWTITYWAAGRQTSTSPETRTTVEVNLFLFSFFSNCIFTIWMVFYSVCKHLNCKWLGMGKAPNTIIQDDIFDPNNHLLLCDDVYNVTTSTLTSLWALGTQKMICKLNIP